MAFRLLEPPAWWVKYKPLRWVLAILVVYWVFGTLLPRWKEEEALPSVPTEVATAEPEPVPAVEEPPPPEREPETQLPPAPAPAPPKPAPPPAPAPKPKPVAPAAPSPEPKPPEPTPAPAPDPMARYTQVETERVPLINSLRSYESVEAIRAALEQAGFKAEMDTIERKGRGNGHPPFRNDTLKVAEYRHGEHTGQLTLEFFNDRLYRTEFSPGEPAEYLGWLRSRGLKLPVKRVGITRMTAGHLQVSSNIDFASSDVGRSMGSKPFVRWEDTRLAQQIQETR